MHICITQQFEKGDVPRIRWIPVINHMNSFLRLGNIEVIVVKYNFPLFFNRLWLFHIYTASEFGSGHKDRLIHGIGDIFIHIILTPRQKK
ncbi:hypothetical protein SDC9_153027 [bioreactor metagenome]|uniref:Uncharacterized protein n=1 Tax=bioreactor metagenome TaxID=1076179 RepID=A0A645EZF3_9ZZZZ